MRKKRLVLLIGSVCLILALCALSSIGVCAPKKVRFSLAEPAPATHGDNTIVYPAWIKDVKEATNGRVEINLYPGQTLLKAPATYSGVIEGAADIGNCTIAATPGRFPLMSILELPGIPFNCAQVSAHVAWDFYNKFKPEELNDVKVFWLTSTGPGVLQTKKPIHNLADLQGMRIRASGRTTATVNALGASAVAMPTPEVYMSLQKGVLDGYLGPPETLKVMKFADLVDYVTAPPFIYNTTFVTFMNLDKWNSLPDDIQKVFDELSPKYLEKHAETWQEVQGVALQYAKAKGIEFIYLSHEEEAKWRKLVEPLRDQYINELETKGLPGRAALDFILKSAVKYNKVYPLMGAIK